MANFDAILNLYRKDLDSKDEENWMQHANFAAEELIGDLQEYLEKKDPDYQIAVILKTMQHYFEIADERYEKRKQIAAKNEGAFRKIVNSKLD